MDTSRRNFILSAAVLAPVVFGGCAATKMLNPISGGTDALLKGLTGSLGGSPTQALGGTAALMNIAKSSLGADKFGSVAQLLPGMDGLLGQAANRLPRQERWRLGRQDAGRGLQALTRRVTPGHRAPPRTVAPVVLLYVNASMGARPEYPAR